MKISRIPYSHNAELQITQGEYGKYSHKKVPALDIVGLNKSKTIYSPCNGLVRVATNSSSKRDFGTYLSLADTDNGNIRIVLAHLKYNSLKVKKGDTVKIGQPIAEEGMTGYATGSHCHMEIRGSLGIGQKSVCAYTGLPNKLGKYKVSDFLKEVGNNYKVTTSFGLNLRVAVGTGSKKLTAIPKNTVIEVTDFYQGKKWLWGRTTYKGKTGWCALTGYTKKV